MVPMKILVLGIGNTLLGDEGVGIRLMHALEAGGGLPGEVECLDGGTLSFTLAGPIEEAGALVVLDAAELSAPAGTWKLFEGDAMDAFLLGKRKSSVHEVGLTDLRAIALLAGHWPERRAMLAIQPKIVDWSETLSPEVAAALSPACAAVRDLILRWRDSHPSLEAEHACAAPRATH